MRIHFFDSMGKFHLHPFVFPWLNCSKDGASACYEEDHSKLLSLRFLIRGETRGAAGTHREAWHLFGVDDPGRVFLLGTDDYGRDQFSRLLYGGKGCPVVGVLAA